LPFVLSPEAQDDLGGIDAYLCHESPGAADRVSRALESTMELLAQHPGMGHQRPDLTSRPVRFWSVYSYLIVYRPDTSPLQVIRVLHGARDVAAILGE
jgi:plasmid stabilization system protein ParE